MSKWTILSLGVVIIMMVAVGCGSNVEAPPTSEAGLSEEPAPEVVAPEAVTEAVADAPEGSTKTAPEGSTKTEPAATDLTPLQQDLMNSIPATLAALEKKDFTAAAQSVFGLKKEDKYFDSSVKNLTKPTYYEMIHAIYVAIQGVDPIWEDDGEEAVFMTPDLEVRGRKMPGVRFNFSKKRQVWELDL